MTAIKRKIIGEEVIQVFYVCVHQCWSENPKFADLGEVTGLSSMFLSDMNKSFK